MLVGLSGLQNYAWERWLIWRIWVTLSFESNSATILNCLAELCHTSAIKEVTNSGNGSIDFGYIGKIAIGLVALYIVSTILSFIQGFVMSGIAQKVAYNLRKEISKKINRIISKLLFKFAYFHPIYLA